MGLVVKDDGWRVPNKLWDEIKPLLPKVKDAHPLGHRQRVPDRRALDAILFVFRTGCHWSALNSTKICSASTAHRRFWEWMWAGVFEKFREKGIVKRDKLKGIDWSWLAPGGAAKKEPLGGDIYRPRTYKSLKNPVK